MNVDDIISYHDLVSEEKAALQKGMNFGVGKKYSVFLMSLRENAPYADALDQVTGMLKYEGHDEPQRKGGPDPKRTRSTANDSARLLDRERQILPRCDGFQKRPARQTGAGQSLRENLAGNLELQRFFELLDAHIVSDGKRKVFKFSLKPVKKKSFGRIVELPHNRLIPTA